MIAGQMQPLDAGAFARLMAPFEPFETSPVLAVAVSGGRDSVALLHWLISLGYERLIVCHLNHHLRGRSSNADARLVQKLAAKYQTEVEIGSANVRVIAKKEKMSIETAN